ncbi:UNVERIFIED_CONTAM: hypothetical protein K2H54_033459 [Gekko kuhli]
MQSYQPGVRKIPTACISVEDAELMARISSRGNKIILTLKMEAKTYPDADSFNTVAEIVGSKYPEQEQSYLTECVHKIPFPDDVSNSNFLVWNMKFGDYSVMAGTLPIQHPIR